jgi:2-methylisocitrate lyase-like PEP mutase family enzyme
MSDRSAKAELFLELHRRGQPLLLANAWDVGSARLLAAAGFKALATTSSGHAASRGRLDYAVGPDEALAHAAELAAAVEVPLSADLEDCFAEDAVGVARTVERAIDAGLAGCSLEDWDPRRERLYTLEEAVERVAGAVSAARSRGPFVLTARAENHLRGNDDLADTIARLRAYEQAGADVLYAPGLAEAGALRELVASTQAPVNVLARPACPPVAELARLGVARISVGGAFAFAAYAAALDAAAELRDRGTYGFTEQSARGARLAREAFSD